MSDDEFNDWDNRIFLPLWEQARKVLEVLGLPVRHLSMISGLYPDLPYHNLHHGLSVGLRAVEEAQEIGLDLDAQRDIMLAGLYHDAWHTGVPEANDADNIQRALMAWTMHGFPLSPRRNVSRLVQATQFPHRALTEIEEIVLANADIAQTLGDRFWSEALRRETGIEGSDAWCVDHLIPYPVAVSG